MVVACRLMATELAGPRAAVAARQRAQRVRERRLRQRTLRGRCRLRPVQACSAFPLKVVMTAPLPIRVATTRACPRSATVLLPRRLLLAAGGGKNAAAAAAGGGAMAASGVLTRPSETDAHRCAVVAVEAAVPCTVRGGGSDARDSGEISGGGDGISSSSIGGGGGGGGSGGDDGASRLVGRARWVRSSEAARVPHRDARAARPGRDARRRALRDGGSCRRGGDCYDFSAKHRERYTHNDDGGGGAARRPVRSSGAGLARAEEDAREALTAALAELAGTTASAPLDALAHVRATAVHVMRHDGARWETLRDEIVTAAATGAGARGALLVA